MHSDRIDNGDRAVGALRPVDGLQRLPMMRMEGIVNRDGRTNGITREAGSIRTSMCSCPTGSTSPEPDGAPVFVAAPALTDQDVQGIVETTAQRVVRLLQRRGLVEQDGVDPLWDEEPLLASLSQSHAGGWPPIGRCPAD